MGDDDGTRRPAARMSLQRSGHHSRDLKAGAMQMHGCKRNSGSESGDNEMLPAL